MESVPTPAPRRRAQGCPTTLGAAIRPTSASGSSKFLPNSRHWLSCLLERPVASGMSSTFWSPRPSMMGSTALGTGSSSSLCCCPALGHLLPMCRVKMRSKAHLSACTLVPSPCSTPWEHPPLCPAPCLGAGPLLLSLCCTSARNKGLSSAITDQCPGSAPQWVRAGTRACGWHWAGRKPSPGAASPQGWIPAPGATTGASPRNRGDGGNSLYLLHPEWNWRITDGLGWTS